MSTLSDRDIETVWNRPGGRAQADPDSTDTEIVDTDTTDAGDGKDADTTDARDAGDDADTTDR